MWVKTQKYEEPKVFSVMSTGTSVARMKGIGCGRER